jgi:GNAT superfamily N-acetyltransferase
LDFASFIYSTREVTEIELDLEKFEPRFSQRSEMAVERVSENELARRSAELPKDWASLLNDFQKKGYLLFWALSEGRVIGFVCFTFGDFYVQDMCLQLHLEKEEGLLYGIFVEEAYRGKTISGVLMEKALVYLKEQGYLRVVAHIDLRNIPSLRYAKSNRYVEVKRWKVRKVFGVVRPIEIPPTGDALNPPRLRRAVPG